MLECNLMLQALMMGIIKVIITIILLFLLLLLLLLLKPPAFMESLLYTSDCTSDSCENHQCVCVCVCEEDHLILTTTLFPRVLQFPLTERKLKIGLVR